MVNFHYHFKKGVSVTTGSLMFLLIITSPFQAKAQENLKAIAGWHYFTSAPDALYRYLSGEAYSLLKERADYVSKIKSLEGWKKQQQKVRETLMKIAGPFPVKTPLNAKITRVVDKKNYRIEHIIFESRPGFYVTSSLFIPKGINKGRKNPVVMYASGHSRSGYRSGAYQKVILNLVNKGFIVYAWDPIGQGERGQYVNQENSKSVVGLTSPEHAFATLPLFLTGGSLAQYVIWDGIRAVDYLMTREEIDPSRIGMTGRSGGGYQSLYIPAFDNRIYATAPENHVTNYTRILQKIGPRDGEHNLSHMFDQKIDHPDFLTARAPKPALIVATTNDLFNIEGTREAFNEVSRAYKAYGKEDNFKMVEDIAPHSSTKKNNEAIYAFFQKYLNNPGNPEEEEVGRLSDEDLRVTKTGQVVTSLNSETVFSINSRKAGQLAEKLNTSWNRGVVKPAGIIESAKKACGYKEPNFTDKPVMTGSIKRDGYIIEKYFIKGEGNYPIPYLLMVPEKKNNKAVIYIDPSGKETGAGKGGAMEWFVRKGFTVLAPDIIGTGETGPGDWSGEKNFTHAVNNGLSYRIWYSSALVGRSILGVRASDVVKLAAMLKNNKAEKVYALARGRMSPVLLHAAAFTHEIDGIALIEPYTSYWSVATTKYYSPSYLESFVPGALQSYDLPYLAASLAPRRVIVQNVKNGGGQKADSTAVRNEYAVASELYRNKNAADNFIIAEGDNEEYVFSELIKN